jgi:hypothetical protein
MVKTKTNAIKSFLIPLSFEDRLSKVANDLPFYARQAYVNRDFDLLKILSDSLINLSPQTEDIGRLYQAYMLSRSDYSVAEKPFAELAESSNSDVRVSAVLALGGIEFRKNNLTEAQKLITLASSSAISKNDPAYLIALFAQSAYSTLLERIGDNNKSLRVLQENELLAERIGALYPATLGEHWNNLACGYLEHGNLEAALYYSTKAVSMRCAVNYPEWFDTLQAIDAKLLKAKKAYAKNLRRKIERLDNLKVFPTPQTCFQIYLTFYKEQYKLLDYYTNESDEADSRFVALINTFDSICSGYRTGIELDGCFLECYEGSYRYHCSIDRENLWNLFQVIRNVKAYETQFPLPLPKIYEPTSSELDFERIVAKVLPMLENPK